MNEIDDSPNAWWYTAPIYKVRALTKSALRALCKRAGGSYQVGEVVAIVIDILELKDVDDYHYASLVEKLDRDQCRELVLRLIFYKFINYTDTDRRSHNDMDYGAIVARAKLFRIVTNHVAAEHPKMCKRKRHKLVFSITNQVMADFQGNFGWWLDAHKHELETANAS
jgi:hypothetical protein